MQVLTLKLYKLLTYISQRYQFGAIQNFKNFMNFLLYEL